MMGSIVTFYSFKGGVGRSMALANVGVLLAQWGYRVLIIDFDLEAPGLESFFDAFLDLEITRKEEGIVDHLYQQFFGKAKQGNLDQGPSVIEIRLPRISGRLDLMTAGRRDDNYFRKVTDLNFRRLYVDKNAGQFLELFRNQLKQNHDIVLMDSRTGLTDIGGVCTVQFPDMIVLVTTATEQALMGGLDIIRRANASRQRVPFPRSHVPTLPIPSRLDSSAELRLTHKWLDRFSTEFSEIYSHWLPRTVKPRALLDVTKLPHVPFFSFGESLAALEYGTNDPAGLGYAYENLGALIARGLNSIEQLITDRDQYIQAAAKDVLKKPAEGASSPRVFISYSHEDQEWADRLFRHMKPLTAARNITVWSDRNIRAGESWREEITEELSKADVAVLLVSADYLASD